MKYHDAKNLAIAMSKDNHCAQYVNRRLDMTYYVSDWFSTDGTVVTCSNGQVLSTSKDDITRREEDTLVLDSKNSDMVEYCTRHPEDAPHTHIRRVWSDDSDNIRERLYTD